MQSPPSAKVEPPCESRSHSAVAQPPAAHRYARFTAVVVLPTPPLIFVTANILTPRAYARGDDRGNDFNLLRCAPLRRCACRQDRRRAGGRKRLAVARAAQIQEPGADEDTEMSDEQKSCAKQRTNDEFHNCRSFRSALGERSLRTQICLSVTQCTIWRRSRQKQWQAARRGQPDLTR